MTAHRSISSQPTADCLPRRLAVELERVTARMVQADEAGAADRQATGRRVSHWDQVFRIAESQFYAMFGPIMSQPARSPAGAAAQVLLALNEVRGVAEDMEARRQGAPGYEEDLPKLIEMLNFSVLALSSFVDLHRAEILADLPVLVEYIATAEVSPFAPIEREAAAAA